MKKVLSLVLALALFLCLVTPSSAASGRMLDSANGLHELGLFNGIGTDENGSPIYDLDRAPSRFEAITMLVRLLGKEDEAKNGTWETPFTDLVDWAVPYVGYAYANGLTNGTGPSTFGGGEPVYATQYLTFVLRALGYTSGYDFQWDRAWELSDSIGLTDGRYSAATSDFTRGDVALISYDALKINHKGSTLTLLDTIQAKNEAYRIYSNGTVPAETGSPKLDAAGISALRGLTPEAAAPYISTLADAYAWLSAENYMTHGMEGSPSVGIANGTAGKNLSWAEMTTVINTLLEGDYDEVGTVIAVAQPRETGWDIFYITFSYIKCGGYYYVTDPTDFLYNEGWACYRAHTIKMSSLDSLKNALAGINGTVSDLITLAVFPLFTDRIQVTYTKDPLSLSFKNIPGVTYLYRTNAEAQELYEKEKQESVLKEAERWSATARTLNVSDYGMPDAIGRTTLTYDEAYALVGQDPAVIAEKVSTVGDVLQYMIAARFGYSSTAAYTPWYGSGSETWGFDAPGDEQLRQNYGCCCGGYANTVSYLLQGDYEKVGTLRWVGGGNHTISWVFTGGKYYVFDFTQYCSGGYYSNRDCPVTVLDRLEDFYERMPDTYSFFPKSEIVIMVAFEAGAAMYPSRWSDPPAFAGILFPSEARGRITVIYQKSPDAGVSYANITCSIPGWNS